MSVWRLSAGDLDSPHCLGEVEWRRLVDTTLVLCELALMPLDPAILLFIPQLESSNVWMATLHRRSAHCLGEVEPKRLVDTTFVLGELTCPSTLQYCYSFFS